LEDRTGPTRPRGSRVWLRAGENGGGQQIARDRARRLLEQTAEDKTSARRQFPRWAAKRSVLGTGASSFFDKWRTETGSIAETFRAEHQSSTKPKLLERRRRRCRPARKPMRVLSWLRERSGLAPDLARSSRRRSTSSCKRPDRAAGKAKPR